MKQILKRLEKVERKARRYIKEYKFFITKSPGETQKIREEFEEPITRHEMDVVVLELNEEFYKNIKKVDDETTQPI